MFQALGYLKARLGLLGRDERGVVTAEYAVLLAAIVGVVAIVVVVLTGKISDIIDSIA